MSELDEIKTLLKDIAQQVNENSKAIKELQEKMVEQTATVKPERTVDVEDIITDFVGRTLRAECELAETKVECEKRILMARTSSRVTIEKLRPLRYLTNF